MDNEIHYTTASYPETDTGNTSLVLGANIGDEQIASVVRIEDEWHVYIRTKSQILKIPIKKAKEIVAEFSSFIDSYNELES